jgi:hypothetical protein
VERQTLERVIFDDCNLENASFVGVHFPEFMGRPPRELVFRSGTRVAYAQFSREYAPKKGSVQEGAATSHQEVLQDTSPSGFWTRVQFGDDVKPTYSLLEGMEESVVTTRYPSCTGRHPS